MSCSALRSGPKDHVGPMNRTGPGPVLSGPQSWSFRFFRERPEKTAVLGPVRTGLGPIQDGNRVDLIFF